MTESIYDLGDFPPGDRQMWDEQYMRGREPQAEVSGEPIIVIDIPEVMPVDEARERLKRLVDEPLLEQ